MNQKPLIFVIFLLIISAFLVGVFYNKTQSLEKKLAQNPIPSPSAQNPPAPQASADQLKTMYETGVVKGEKDAKVTIVEFSDFQCPYCARHATETLPQIDKNYIQTGKVRYIFHHFPLSFHEFAQKAAEASMCANDQGKFWEMHDKIFADQTKMALSDLQKQASGLGLKSGEFNTCLSSGKYSKVVTDDVSLGSQVGVMGTPAFFINGVFLSGAQPFANFQQIIEKELGK